MKKIFVLLIIMGLAAALTAQPNKKNMDAIRIWKMTEVLELTSDQSEKFLPALQIHEREMKEIQKNLATFHEQSQAYLSGKGVSQKEVDAMVKSYMEKQDEMHASRQAFLKGLAKYLTPEQQLKFIGFENSFRQDLRDYMKDRRRPRAPGKGRRP